MIVLEGDKTETEILRGHQADTLIRNELYVEAWQTLKEVYTKTLLATNPDQQAEREKLYVALKILDAVQANLTDVINTGKIAESHLNWLTESRKAEELMNSANKGTKW